MEVLMMTQKSGEYLETSSVILAIKVIFIETNTEMMIVLGKY
jgi:hypothetical protein